MFGKEAKEAREKHLDLMEKIRKAICAILIDITKVKQMYTNREIAIKCGLEPARISEIYMPVPLQRTRLSVNTFRKLLGGGIVKIDELLQHMGKISPEQEAFIRKFIVYEDPDLTKTAEEMMMMGKNPVPYMHSVLVLLKNGVDVQSILDKELHKLK